MSKMGEGSARIAKLTFAPIIAAATISMTIFGFFFANAAIAAAPVPAKVTLAIRLYGRVLATQMPPDFLAQEPQQNRQQFLMEFVPKGETVENWTRLVTIQAFPGAGRLSLSTAEFAEKLLAPAGCTDGSIYHNDGEKVVRDGLTLSIITNGCATLPGGIYAEAKKGAGEQDFIMMFRDADTIYTLNYAERGVSFTGKAPPIDIARAAAILHDQFGDVNLCAKDTEPGCAAPIAMDAIRRQKASPPTAASPPSL